MVAGSTELYHEQSVKDMVKSARENARTWKPRQVRRKMGLPGFYYRRAFQGSKMVDCALLSEMKLMAQEVLSHSALHWRLN